MYLSISIWGRGTGGGQRPGIRHVTTKTLPEPAEAEIRQVRNPGIRLNFVFQCLISQDAIE